MIKPIKPSVPKEPKKPQQITSRTYNFAKSMYDGQKLDDIFKEIKELENKVYPPHVTHISVDFSTITFRADHGGDYDEAQFEYDATYTLKLTDKEYNNKIKVYETKYEIYKGKLNKYKELLAKYEKDLKIYKEQKRQEEEKRELELLTKLQKKYLKK